MNDYAGLLPAAQRQQLDAQIAERERATGAQMAIAIFPSLEGENLEDVSIRLAQQWRIGQKGLDNGVILVVFVNDRKLRLEVGYGLEPVVTDALASQIVREQIAPRFREQRYLEGLEAAVDTVYARVAQARGTAPPPPVRRPRGAQPGWSVLGFVVLLAVIGALLLPDMLVPARRARRSAYTAGSGGWNAPIVVVPPPWWRGGGGGGGFGDGGGGFSGGGGSFGGGGASGEW